MTLNTQARTVFHFHSHHLTIQHSRRASPVAGGQVEINDVAVYALGKFGGDEFLKRGSDQFDVLYAESATNARVMAISIHPYLTGVPHRIKYLEQLLDYIAGHEGVAFMTASEVGDWYTAAMRALRNKRPREGDAE